MPRIIWEGSRFGEWNPGKEEILLPTDPTWKEYSPMVLSHELGHQRLGHGRHLGTSLHELVLERDAWVFALSKLPPEEINLELVEYSLDDYLGRVDLEFGEGPELEFAKKIKGDLMKEAKRRKRQ